MARKVVRGDVYYAELSPVVGSEQGGERPVIVLQNDKGNLYSPTVVVAPITSKKDKPPLPTHVHIGTDTLSCESIVLLEQIRTIDKARLLRYVGSVTEQTMCEVNTAIKISLGVD